jgi:hypothetical protein
MALPVTRYAKSGDVHIAYKSLAAGQLGLREPMDLYAASN